MEMISRKKATSIDNIMDEIFIKENYLKIKLFGKKIDIDKDDYRYKDKKENWIYSV